MFGWFRQTDARSGVADDNRSPARIRSHRQRIAVDGNGRTGRSSRRLNTLIGQSAATDHFLQERGQGQKFGDISTDDKSCFVRTSSSPLDRIAVPARRWPRRR